MRALAVATVLCCALLTVAAEDKPAVKEIPTKDLKLTFPEGGKATEPKEIKSVEDLKKSEVVGGAADELMKQVSFDKEKLVVFAWGGSGGDRLTASIKDADGKTTAVFALKRGLTRDFRRHFHLYVVPRNATVQVVPTR